MSKIGILCATIAVLMAVAAYLLQSYYRDLEKPELLLGVCVLSARDHQEQRTAIRNTWLTADDGMTNDSKHNRTLVKFVVGSKACPVHPADRLDQYGCREWTPNMLPDLKRDFEAFVKEEKLNTGPSVNVLSIRVLHPVILKRFGILESIPLSEEPLTVSVYKDFDEEEMSSVQFTQGDPGIVHRGFRYQPIQPVLLHKVGTS